MVTRTKDLYSKRDIGAFDVSEFGWEVGADPDCAAETRENGQFIARWELYCLIETHLPGPLDVGFGRCRVFFFCGWEVEERCFVLVISFVPLLLCFCKLTDNM